MNIQPQNNNLNYLIDVLSFARDNAGDNRDSFSHYYVPNVEIKDFNVLIDGKRFFDLPVKNKEEAYYTTGNFLDFAYFLKKCKLIAIDLSTQTKLKHPQQFSFIGRLLNTRGATMFFIIKKSDKENFKFFTKFCHIHINNGSTKDCKFIKWF